MSKQKGGNRPVIISIVAVLAIAGIVVGILFATGVLGKKSPIASKNLGPGTNNPGAGTPVSVELSNPVINMGQPNLPPAAVDFNIQLSPEPLSLKMSDGIFNETIVLTFSDGTTNTLNKQNPVLQSSITGASWQGEIHGEGLNRIPAKVDISGFYSYKNQYGISVDGPVSNTISVNIPTKY